ncbi:NADPH-dependent FMN reductase [Panacagrimonas sp.]|uniref:NADPH-dependent FMN reductase n=1 Tax=Panacagrimonas sp. TaxID=2480088 RepID=UPI003B527091
MTKLLGISGSLRKASYNTALLRAAQGLVPPDVELELVTLHGIPLYDGDLEQAEGIPEAVTALKQKVLACHGLLIATPEYNNGMPGVLKNALDWLSRPPKESASVFGDRAVALLGATPGGMGTVSAQAAWLPVLKALGVRTWSGGRLLASRAGQLFDDQGALSDETMRKQLQVFVAGFAAFAVRPA